MSTLNHTDRRRKRSTGTPDAEHEALDTAENLRDDLEAIAASDLPFAYDAKQILEALDNAQKQESN